MNQVVLIGRLTSDVNLREGDTTVASFRLAVNKDTSDGGADFIQCKAFGRVAENLAKYKHKGDEIAVMGRISTGSYKNREGATVRTTDVICNKIEFTHGNKAESSEPRGESFRPVQEPPRQRVELEEIPDTYEQLEEDLPF